MTLICETAHNQDKQHPCPLSALTQPGGQREDRTARPKAPASSTPLTLSTLVPPWHSGSSSGPGSFPKGQLARRCRLMGSLNISHPPVSPSDTIVTGGHLQGPEAPPTDHFNQTLPHLEEPEKTICDSCSQKKSRKHFTHLFGVLLPLPESP
jgi:hypothetical protein